MNEINEYMTIKLIASYKPKLTQALHPGGGGGVKGEFKVGLGAAAKPLLFLLDTQGIGLQPLQLEAGTLP